MEITFSPLYGAAGSLLPAFEWKLSFDFFTLSCYRFFSIFLAFCLVTLKVLLSIFLFHFTEECKGEWAKNHFLFSFATYWISSKSFGEGQMLPSICRICVQRTYTDEHWASHEVQHFYRSVRSCQRGKSKTTIPKASQQIEKEIYFMEKTWENKLQLLLSIERFTVCCHTGKCHLIGAWQKQSKFRVAEAKHHELQTIETIQQYRTKTECERRSKRWRKNESSKWRMKLSMFHSAPEYVRKSFCISTYFFPSTIMPNFVYYSHSDLFVWIFCVCAVDVPLIQNSMRCNCDCNANSFSDYDFSNWILSCNFFCCCRCVTRLLL